MSRVPSHASKLAAAAMVYDRPDEALGDTLSRISGIPRSEMQQVKRNHMLLAGCDHHIFNDCTPDKPLNKKYRCARCLGEIDSQAYYWFTKGQEHARMGV